MPPILIELDSHQETLVVLSVSRWLCVGCASRVMRPAIGVFLVGAIITIFSQVMSAAAIRLVFATIGRTVDILIFAGHDVCLPTVECLAGLNNEDCGYDAGDCCECECEASDIYQRHQCST